MELRSLVRNVKWIRKNESDKIFKELDNWSQVLKIRDVMVNSVYLSVADKNNTIVEQSNNWDYKFL